MMDTAYPTLPALRGRCLLCDEPVVFVRTASGQWWSHQMPADHAAIGPPT